MKKLILIFGLFVIGNSLWSQCQWQFGVETSAFKTTGLRKEYLGSATLHNPKSSYSIGLISAQRFNERWMFSSGLQYGYFQHETILDNFRWGSQHDGNGGFNPDIDPGENIKGTSYLYTHQYLGVPLSLRYNFTTGPWRLYTEQGIIGRLTLDSTEKIRPDWRQVAQEEWVASRKAFTLVWQSGIGLEHTLGRNKFVFLEPNLLIGRGPEDNYFSYGLSLGYRVVYR